MKTITDKNRTSLSITADYKYDYYYKIRPYRLTGKSKIYGAYSKAVRIKYSSKSFSNVRVTAYCACRYCNGYWSRWKNGTWATQTASGKWLYNKKEYANKYCAATPAVGKLGDKIKIKLNGKTLVLTIVDRLGSNSGYAIDYFIPSTSCERFGVKRASCKVYK